MLKLFIKLLSHLFPNLAVNYSFSRLSQPQTKKLKPKALQVLNTAHKQTLAFQNFNIQLYIWEGGPKKVLLIHGWEGNTGNFSSLILALIKANYTVYGFDAPSHGNSSKGKTHLFAFSDLVEVLLNKFEIKNVVSHSFGGVAATYALYKNTTITIDKYVLLTTPDKFSERIDYIAQQVGISHKIKQRLIEKLELASGKKISDLEVSKFVKNISVNKALIIHDKKDRVIPITQSQNVNKNWDNCSLLEIENTGHFKILHTKKVIEQVINFLN